MRKIIAFAVDKCKRLSDITDQPRHPAGTTGEQQMNTTYRHHSDKARASIRRGYYIGSVGRFAFDAFLFSITVGIWGFIISMMILKWVMP